MILDSVKIERKSYGTNEGQYIGTVSFYGKDGSVTVKLPAEAAHEILKLCAANIIEEAGKVASAMIAPVIELKATAKIEEKKKGRFF